VYRDGGNIMNTQYARKVNCIGGYGVQNIIDETNDILAHKRIKRPDNIGCGVILLDHDGKIILGTRTDLPESVYNRIIQNGEEFKWTIAGGGMEFNESPLYCAIRELKEEFGIEAGKQTTHLKIVGFHDNYFVRGDRVKPKRDFAFITTLKRNTTIDDIVPQIGEIGRVQAFTKEEVLDMISQEKIYKASKTSLLMAINMGYL
jgi:8-oxo-dGTP pyrophosphatase MutT (NUDIX family)